jgi:hypothetical protein
MRGWQSLKRVARPLLDNWIKKVDSVHLLPYFVEIYAKSKHPRLSNSRRRKTDEKLGG